MKAALKQFVVTTLTGMAALLLRRKRPTIIAVTGSVGKTTTKDAIYTAIKKHSYARKSEKSYNSDIGVPLTVLGLANGWNNPFLWARNLVDGFFTAFFAREYPDVLVLETGIDRPGDMERLTAWLKPDIVVLTRLPNVPVHVEYFASPEAVVTEKMHLVSAMRPDGVLIYNADDETIQAQLSNVLQTRVGFGRYRDTDFKASADRLRYHDDRPVGVECTITHADQSAKVVIPDTIGTQYVYACSAAVAVADRLGIALPDAANALSNFRTPNGRMRIIQGVKSSLLIDDTYNSSPIAVEAALQALGEIQYAKRKIVVLGDMLELGKYSSPEHRKIGERVPDVADVLFTVGVRSRAIAQGALARGLDEAHVRQYDDVGRAGRELQAFLQPGDVVLVKASQGVRAERIIEEVMTDPERAGELLPRQDRAWRKLA
jgi:UDP-N-acetylmuramoyl-tripeptide--D-alanyl-D-alanine ligase